MRKLIFKLFGIEKIITHIDLIDPRKTGWYVIRKRNIWFFGTQ